MEGTLYHFPNSGHHLGWMQLPSDARTKLRGQKHPGTHFLLAQKGNRFLQVLSQAVPHALNTSPAGHSKHNSYQNIFQKCWVMPYAIYVFGAIFSASA